ncbi:hypothetical protein ACFQVD_40015 [Streptosporangium amethystogenes subsp. fukuiense]|uniref:Uncharacterized protein n=1 Tax=Streptosporangium amethystogenes subsp. fukuiense TaxID=698418 RepID=A0ABW2TE23_9ACTN
MSSEDLGTPAPELELEKNWPGLDGAPANGGPNADHARIKKIAEALRHEVDTLKGSMDQGGYRDWFGPQVGPADTGKWKAADYFGQNVTQGYRVLTGKYQALLEQYEALVVAIEKAVKNYEKSHDASSA